MTPHDSRELIQLWLLANEGAANEAQLKSLNSRIETSGEARQLLISLAGQQGWMKWNAVSAEPQLGAASTLPSCAEFAALAIDDERPSRGMVQNVTSAAEMGRGSGRSSGWSARVRQLAFSEYGVAAVVALACLMGYLAGRREAGRLEAPTSMAAIEPLPHATMVSSTGCVWGAGEAGVPSHGKKFASGDTLQLLEGIAEFSIGAKSDVKLQMEGPTSVVLASDLGVSMSYGKIILNSMSYDGRPFPIDTTFGRILVDYGAEVGLITFGSKAEIHCFQGRVTVESPWLAGNEHSTAAEALSAGESMAFDHVGQAGLQVNRGVADKHRFTPQVAMSNDFLSVTPEYVEEVLISKPVAYWRFEQTVGGVVRNEMGPAYEGQVRGTVNWAGPAGNHVIELGLAEDPGSMLVEDSWDDVLTGDFSVELWMKPSHHHLGSLVGFVGPFDPKLRQNKYGVLLEIGGPVNRYSRSRVNQLRFLHRAPLSVTPAMDANCFSEKTYVARRWQHVVATKERDKLRLFVDGALVDSTESVNQTPSGLQLVIGQLYTDSLDRFFVGQLDEIAIYDRALSPREAARHHELLRPTTTKAKDVL